ncbi:MAG: hypothetical protein HZB18_09635 [Chloroflexi bacterium]|nr:hypothetical protein [Chloroflexota bacterium]
MKKLRLLLALLILAVSFSLLLWGYLPNPREVIDRDIPPAEMQLPTPTSLHPYPLPVL